MGKFLKRLMREKILGLVEPNDTLSQAYLKKSESYFISANILLENARLEETVTLSYYTMYYSLKALLFKVGIKCDNHSGSIILLKEVFKVDNSDIIMAKRERLDKQYYVNFDITKFEVDRLVNVSKRFNIMIYNFISKLSNEDIISFRKNFG